MLKKISIIAAFIYFSAFAFVFEDDGADTLSADKKLCISDLVKERQKGIYDDKIKFGIVSDMRKGVKSKTPDLIMSYMIDSIGLDKDAVLKKHYAFIPPLETPVKPVRLPYIEISPVTNVVRMELIAILDSVNTVRKGDTVTVGENGFALIHYNNNHRITLHPNAKISAAHSSIYHFKGGLSVSQSDKTFPYQYMSPLNIITSEGELYLNGDAYLSIGDFTVLQVYKGTATFKHGETNYTVTAGNAISISTNGKKIIKQPILNTPVFFEKSVFALLPGDSYNYENTGGFNRRIIVANENDEIIADTTVGADGADLTLGFGKMRFFAQDTNEFGIVSDWARKDVNIREMKGLKSLEIFDDTLYYVSDNRPFTFRGVADTAVKIFIDYDEISVAENGFFSKSVMLKDSLNYPEIIVQYKDLSGDTIAPTIYYTGFDERITMNDSIMGKPAFTTGRSYKWRGYAPTAVNIRVNNEELKLAEDGYYEKILHTQAFLAYPVITDVIYENGNSKTFTRTLTHEKYMNSGELGMREFIITIVVATFISTMSMVSAFGEQR